MGYERDVGQRIDGDRKLVGVRVGAQAGWDPLKFENTTGSLDRFTEALKTGSDSEPCT